MANPVIPSGQHHDLPSNETRGPIQGLYRNLGRIFQPFDQIGIELKKEALATLPPEFINKIYLCISKFHGKTDENLDFARSHIFDLELPLQVAVYSIFLSSIINQLPEEKQAILQRNLSAYKFNKVDGEGPNHVIQLGEIGIVLDMLGDIENEPSDPFISKDSLANTTSLIGKKTSVLDFAKSMLGYHFSSPNFYNETRMPLILLFYQHIHGLVDVIYRDPTSVERLMRHLSSSEQWQASGICFKTINDLLSKQQFNSKIIDTYLFETRSLFIDSKAFINFIFHYAISCEYKNSSNGNRISLLLDLVNFIKSNIFFDEKSQTKLLKSYFSYQELLTSMKIPFSTQGNLGVIPSDINYRKYQIGSAPQLIQNLESLISCKSLELLLDSYEALLGDNSVADLSKKASQYQSNLSYFGILIASTSLLAEAFLGSTKIALPSSCSNKELKSFLSYLKNEIDKTLADDHLAYDKRLLSLILDRSFYRLNNMNENLENNLSGVISFKKLSYYHKAFEIDIAPYFSIIDAPRGRSAHELLTAYRKIYNYGKVNESKYRNYLYRIEEISSSVHVLISQAKKDLFILQNISAFIKKGDLKELCEHLTATTNLEEQDRLFFEAISRFSLEHDPGAFEMNGSQSPSEDPSNGILQRILKQRMPGIRLKLVDIPETLITLLDAFMKNSSGYTNFLFEGADYFEPYIQSTVASCCESSSSKHLGTSSSQPFLNSSKKAGKQKEPESKKTSKKQDKKKKKGKEKTSSLQQSSSSSSSSSAFVAQEDLRRSASSSSSSLRAGSSTELPQNILSASAPIFESRLQNAKEVLSRYFTNLPSQRSSYTRMALKDAQEHLDLLLSTMRHLDSSLNSPHFSKEALFAFVNDCIRHSTLGVEQLLVALYRETNAIQSTAEMFPHQIATHDLLDILEACNLEHGDLSASCRQWLKQINCGEVILRHRNQIRKENAALSHLLEERDQLLNGSSNHEHLIQALCNYLLPLEDFLTSVQPLFSLNPDSFQITSLEFKGLISDVFAKISSPRPLNDDEKTATPNPLLDQLSVIRKNLEAILTSDSSARFYGELDNIQNCLLIHLEQEIEVQSELELIQASLHLSNVILLNQQIVESILLHLIFSRGVSLSFEEQSQHNLLDLIGKIEFPLEKFSKEEMEFLKDIKQKRQLIRYPAFYNSQWGPNGKKAVSPKIEEMRQLVASAKSLYSSQRADQDLKGFTSSSRNAARDLEKIKIFTQKDTETMVSIVQKLIH